jgi:hypothetical protein
MPTADEAIEAVRARLDGGGFAFPLYYHGEPSANLPDVPATFGVVVFENFGSVLAGFGGGRGQNLYRNSGVVSVYVFSPFGYGQQAASSQAEPVATRLRSYRDDVVSIFNADVKPFGPGADFTIPGLSSEVSNYQCALVEAYVQFDQVG